MPPIDEESRASVHPEFTAEPKMEEPLRSKFPLAPEPSERIRCKRGALNGVAVDAAEVNVVGQLKGVRVGVDVHSQVSGKEVGYSAADSELAVVLSTASSGGIRAENIELKLVGQVTSV